MTLLPRKASVMIAFVVLIGLIVSAFFIPIIGKWILGFIGLITHGERDARARTNIDLLDDRVKATLENDLKLPESSVIIDMPQNYVIFGYDMGQEEIDLKAEENFWRSALAILAAPLADAPGGHNVAPRKPLCATTLERPSACDAAACLCAYHLESGTEKAQSGLNCQEFEPRLVGCRKLDDPIQRIQGTDLALVMGSEGPDATLQTSDRDQFVLASVLGPRQVRISLQDGGKTLLLDARLPS